VHNIVQSEKFRVKRNKDEIKDFITEFLK